MTRKFCSAAVKLFSVAMAVPVPAIAQIANDLDNYLGDKLRISVDTPVTRPGPDKAAGCLPAGSTMRAVGRDGGNLLVQVERGTRFKSECDEKSSPLLFDKAYKVGVEDLKNSGLARSGLTYGALMVPFKYQMTGDQDFTGSATLGGYVGYRFESIRRRGITATPIAFLGASNISVEARGTDTARNVMGVSYGVGLIGTLKGSFQAGVVAGWDRVGKGEGYQYNGKPWLAIQFGYAFLQ